MVKITKNSKVEPLALALFPESSQMIKKSLEKPQVTHFHNVALYLKSLKSLSSRNAFSYNNIAIIQNKCIYLKLECIVIINNLVVYVNIYFEIPTQRLSSTLSVQGCKDPQGTANIQTAQLCVHRCSWVTLATSWANLCASIDGILRYPFTAPTNIHTMDTSELSL